MKTRIVFFTIIALIAGILVAGCGEKSKQDVKELNKDLIKGAKNTAEEIKVAAKEDWGTFKKASENTIENMEKEIKVLRKKILKTSKMDREKLLKKLDELERKNIVLKDKLVVRSKKIKENLIEFNEKTKDNEKAFKREFNYDMKELETALKNLFKDNVN